MSWSRRWRCSRSCSLLVGPGRIAGDFAAKSGREAAPTGGHRRPAVGIGVGTGAVLGLRPRRIRIGSGQGDRHGQLPDLLEPARWSRDAGPECPLRAPGAARGGRAARLSRLLHLLRRRCRNRNPPGPRTRRRTGGGVSRRPGDRPRGIAHRLDLGRPVGDDPGARRRGVDLRAGAGSRGAATDRADQPRSRFFARRPIRVPAPALALVAIAFAVPAVAAGLALAATTNRLQSSDDELARGQLDAAAADARSAAAILPWSSTPWLKLATIELAAGNARAARAVVGRAIDLAPLTISASGCSRLRSRRASATTRSSALTRNERSHSRRSSCRES